MANDKSKAAAAVNKSKAEDWTETKSEVKEEAKPPAAEAKKPRKKGQRTPIADRLAAAPTPARKAIIIEGQLQMINKRRAAVLALVSKDVLDQVDPTLLKA